MKPTEVFSILALVLILTSAVALGQSKGSAKARRNLSGTWQLDPRRSNVGEIGKGDEPIKIVYNEPELKLTRVFERDGQRVEREFVYYTDGRGEINSRTIALTTQPNILKSEERDRDTIKSKTTWHGDTLRTQGTLRNLIRGRVLEYEIVDEWKLSADEKTLTQTSRLIIHPDGGEVFDPARRADDKRVYALVSR